MNIIQAAIAGLRAHRRAKNAVVPGYWGMTMEGCLFPGRKWKPVYDVFATFDKETQRRLTFTPEDGEWVDRVNFWKRELRPKLTPEMYHEAMLKICGWYVRCVRRRHTVRLPAEIVAMLRGEVSYTGEVKDLAELSIYAYQDGKAGVPYEPVKADPGFPTWTAPCLDRLLRAAHFQGRVDAGLSRHAENTKAVCLVDLEAVAG